MSTVETQQLMKTQNASCWACEPILKSSWAVSVLLPVQPSKVSLSVTYFSSAVAPECCDKAASSHPTAKQWQRPLVHNQGPALRNVPWHWLIYCHRHSHGIQLAAALQHWCDWSHTSNPWNKCEVNLYICSGHLLRISEHRAASLELLSFSKEPANCLEFLD